METQQENTVEMKPKDYDKKRKDLKIEKREISKTKFTDVNIRKKAVSDIKRSYRSLKRSEKNFIKTQIEKELEH